MARTRPFPKSFGRGGAFENMVGTGDANKCPSFPLKAANDVAAGGQHETPPIESYDGRPVPARAGWLLVESVCQRVHLPLPLWERSDRIAYAIRVRGYALSMDLNPSPQPSPTRGEGAHLRSEAHT